MKPWDKFLNFFRKESAARSALALVNLPNPVMSPRNYKAFAKEGYQQNVVAYRSVSGIAKAAGSVPWTLYHKKNKNLTEIESHPLLDLLNRPNPMQGMTQFFEALTSNMFISGNCYIEGVDSNLKNGNVIESSGKPPKELYVLRSDLMKIQPGSNGFPAAYIFDTHQNKITYKVDFVNMKSAILHVKFFHPIDQWYGMSPIEAAIFSIDQHNEAGRWNLSLLQNKSVPSGAFVVEPSATNPMGTVSHDQMQRMKQEIMERYTGASNAGRPLLLTGGMKFQPMSFSPEDMNWIEGKNSSSRDIALALGYPPMLLGIQGDNTYSNQKEARLALYEETVLPWLEFLKDELNNWLTPAFGDNLYLCPNPDDIPALAIKREAVWNRIQTADFLTDNEKREAVGYEKYKDPAADVIYKNAGLLPIDSLDNPALEFENENSEPIMDEDETDEDSELEGDENGEETDEEKSKKENSREINSKAISVKDRTNRFDHFVNVWINRHADSKVKQVYSTISRKVVKKVRQTIIDNKTESITVIAKEIQKAVRNETAFSKARAIRVARTEIAIATNEGMLGAAKALGIPDMQKEWIPSPDNDRARDNHQAMRDTIIHINEKFLVPNPLGSPDEMTGPGDPSAPPEQIVNCGCLLGFVVPKDGKNFNLNSQAQKLNAWNKINAQRKADINRMTNQIYFILNDTKSNIVSMLEGITDVRMAEHMVLNGLSRLEKDLKKIFIANLRLTLKKFGSEIFEKI